MTETTDLRVEVCERHRFTQIPPLRERVAVAGDTISVIEIDEKATPCAPFPEWDAKVSGKAVEVRLLPPPPPDSEVICIQLIQP